MKIVLANTVGVDSGGWNIIPYPSRWTTASKGFDDQYTYYPRDLAWLSALLKRDTPHDVRLLDGCLSRWNREEYAAAIIAERPDWLVMENSTRTYSDDAWIITRVREETGAKVVLTGQHVSAFPDEGRRVADVVAVGEYLGSVRSFFVDGPDDRTLLASSPDTLIDVADLPFPEDDDVSRYAYALNADQVCEYREIQIYATRGCPFRCAYCVARHTYFGGPQFRLRPVERVVDEIRTLVAKYPAVEGFFFDDEIHNGNIKYTKELCRAIIAAGLNGYKYEAMCAYAPFDEEAVRLMREAGYYKVRIGVETASDLVADAMGLKGKYRPDRLDAFLRLAGEVGLKVYATFTLGGKGATEVEDEKTVRLIESLMEEGLIYDCQVSICTPQPGAPFYDWAVAERLVTTDDWSRFDGGEEAVISLPGYPAERIVAMRKRALDAYDRARNKRDRAAFMENFAEGVERFGLADESILLFRASRDWHLTNTFDAVRDSLTGPVSFLCHRPFADRYRRDGVTVIPVDEEGFLNWERLDEATRQALADARFGLALIPTNTLHCRSYGNVLTIARRIGAGRTLFVNAAGRLIEPDPQP
jgi:radical SAM superfamily enzyme YgiQ (UPF0313 family)